MKELKKNPNADFDDFWEGYSKKKVDKIESDYQDWYDKYGKDSKNVYKLQNDKYIIEKGYDRVKKNTQAAAVVSAMFAMPVAAIVAGKATKNISSGKKRAAIVLAAMGGSVIGITAATAAKSSSTLRRTEEEYGIR